MDQLMLDLVNQYYKSIDILFQRVSQQMREQKNFYFEDGFTWD